MARTALTPVTLKVPFADVAANSLDLTFTACDVVNGNYFACTGKEIVMIKNGTGTNTITFDSVDDPKGRQEDLTYSIGASEIAYWTGSLTNARGWKQTNGQIYINASSTEVTVCVLRLPTGYPGS